MKTSIFMLALPLWFAAITPVSADDAEVIYEQNKTLQQMLFRESQLKLQASMADSLRKMSDSGFLVDEDGRPIGVPDMELLAKEIRRKGGAAPVSDLPFSLTDPVIPNAAPFMLNQPTMGFAGSAPAAPQGSLGGSGFSDQSANTEEDRKVFFLTEIRDNSIMVRTKDGLKELKIGQKVYDFKLTRFDVDTAYFTGPDGSRVVKIDWTQSKRYADD